MAAFSRRATLGASLTAALSSSGGVAQPRPAGRPVRIEVVNDESGPYADLAGPGSALAVRMAVSDAAAVGLKRPVEVIVGDHQNKPDVGVALIREWFAAGGVDCVVDVANSAVSLAAQSLAVQYDRLILHVGSTTSELTGPGRAARRAACNGRRTPAPTRTAWPTACLPRAREAISSSPSIMRSAARSKRT